MTNSSDIHHAGTARQAPIKHMLLRLRGPVLAVLDQALYALSNLMLQVLVARSVTEDAFGAFTVATSLFVILAMAHQTILVEPMFVLGPRHYSRELGRYYDILRGRWSAGAGLGAMMLCLLSAWAFRQWESTEIALCMIAYALAAPLILYFWLMRRMAFALLRIDLAVIANGIYCTIMLLSLAGFMLVGLANAYSGIALSAAASLVGALIIRMRLPWPQRGQDQPGGVFREHLQYGRWAFGSEVLSWGIANCAMLILPIWMGLATSALLRILILLFMPMLQICSVMALLLLRRSAKASPEISQSRGALRHCLIFLAAGSAYGIGVVLLAPPLIPLVFGSQYVVEPGWILLAAVSGAFTVGAQPLFTALRAAERPRDVMIAHMVAFILIISLLYGLEDAGIAGALIAQTVGWLAAMLSAIFFLARLDRHLA
ncbi:lipopolysaccharide biosynthesis protein [Pseudoroseomonas sp. WGS1072]|uniref:lipopolysaccharide biosynthesis protein n=1 Tax=Roseomonas sp. WGS1072 TaxID=3366816 RepID=UPI003BEFC87D